MLNNDIDEAYRATASLVKEKGAKLLKLYLRGQYPTKTQPEIAALYRKKMTTLPLEVNIGLYPITFRNTSGKRFCTTCTWTKMNKR
jgi:hypothetical protein